MQTATALRTEVPERFSIKCESTVKGAIPARRRLLTVAQAVEAA